MKKLGILDSVEPAGILLRLLRDVKEQQLDAAPAALPFEVQGYEMVTAHGELIPSLIASGNLSAGITWAGCASLKEGKRYRLWVPVTTMCWKTQSKPALLRLVAHRQEHIPHVRWIPLVLMGAEANRPDRVVLGFTATEPDEHLVRGLPWSAAMVHHRVPEQLPDRRCKVGLCIRRSQIGMVTDELLQRGVIGVEVTDIHRMREQIRLTGSCD